MSRMTSEEAKGRRVAIYASAPVILANLLLVLWVGFAPGSGSTWYFLLQMTITIAVAVFLFLGHRWARSALLAAQILVLPFILVLALMTLSVFERRPPGETIPSNVRHLWHLDALRMGLLLFSLLALYALAVAVLLKSKTLEAH